MEPKTKIVSHPVIVPTGNYCWKHEALTPYICSRFDNEGGHPSCDLFRLEDFRRDEKGVLKPDVCKNLEEA